MSEAKAKKETIITPFFRVSYPHVFKPSSVTGDDKEMYSIQMLVPKATDITPITKILMAAGADKWGPDKKKWPKLKNYAIKDGDKLNAELVAEEKEAKKEQAGMWVIKASTNAEYKAPQAIGPDMQPLLESDLYPGCWARAAVSAHAYQNANTGIKLNLIHVQKWKDDEVIGGGVPAEQMFGALAVEEGVGEETEVGEDAGFM